MYAALNFLLCPRQEWPKTYDRGARVTDVLRYEKYIQPQQQQNSKTVRLRSLFFMLKTQTQRV